MTWLLDSAGKVSLVIAVGLLAAVLLRHRSAALRHWVLAAALLCATAMPVLEAIVPAWRIDLSSRPAPAPVARPNGAARESAEVATVVETVTVAPSRQASPSPPSAALRLALWIWIAGALSSLALLVIGLARLTWLASRARAVESEVWIRLVDRIGRDLSLRPVRLLQSDHPSLLVTWGLFRPKVILPRAAQRWSEERAAIVLRHELAHIRRGDWIVQIAGELLRAVYWFNPLLWIACARIRQESEQACDDEVLQSGVDGPDYATHLLAVARLLRAESAPRLPAPAIARSSNLERRVRAMLDGRLIRTPATRPARVLTFVALLLFTVALAAAQTGPVTLSGSVLDPTGAPVPNASVVLTNASRQARYEVTSDSGGRFTFVPLPADVYALTVTLPGFKKSDDRVTLAGKTVQRNVSLSLGELQETISVRGPREGGTGASSGSRVTSVDLARSRAAFEAETAGCAASSAGGRIRPPRKIKDVKPLYADSVRAAGISGRVKLQATLATDGTVREVHVVESANGALDDAAIEAVRQWQFDGTLLNCVPVEVTMNVSVDFAIQ